MLSEKTLVPFLFSFITYFTLAKNGAGYIPQYTTSRRISLTPASSQPPLRLFAAGENDSNEWDRKIDENVQRRLLQQKPDTANMGMGETAAGAVLGGLLLGPFGALFGASIGSNWGAKNAVNRLRNEEMAQLGLTPEILDMAQSVGQALEQSVAGLEATRDSFETQKRLAQTFETEASRLHDTAMAALQSGDEQAARDTLMRRTQLVQDKLKPTLVSCAEEKRRVEVMESNVAELQKRALEVESLIKRTVASSAVDSSPSMATSKLSLEREDPLLQKFKDMGID